MSQLATMNRAVDEVIYGAAGLTEDNPIHLSEDQIFSGLMALMAAWFLLPQREIWLQWDDEAQAHDLDELMGKFEGHLSEFIRDGNPTVGLIGRAAVAFVKWARRWGDDDAEAEGPASVSRGFKLGAVFGLVTSPVVFPTMWVFGRIDAAIRAIVAVLAWRPAAAVEALPTTRLIAMLRLVVSARDYELVLIPTARDVQDDYIDAVATGTPFKQGLVVALGRLRLIIVAARVAVPWRWLLEMFD